MKGRLHGNRGRGETRAGGRSTFKGTEKILVLTPIVKNAELENNNERENRTRERERCPPWSRSHVCYPNCQEGFFTSLLEGKRGKSPP